jgi:ribosome-associated translation inhibitor RaiA
MLFKFESNNPEAAQMRDIAETRLRFVIRRMEWRVPKASVYLTDVNGLRAGGQDKCCRVEFKLDHAESVVVTSSADDWRSAIDQALARANRTLKRALERKDTLARRQGRAPARAAHSARLADASPSAHSGQKLLRPRSSQEGQPTPKPITPETQCPPASVALAD